MRHYETATDLYLARHGRLERRRKLEDLRLRLCTADLLPCQNLPRSGSRCGVAPGSRRRCSCSDQLRRIRNNTRSAECFLGRRSLSSTITNRCAAAPGFPRVDSRRHKPLLCANGARTREESQYDCPDENRCHFRLRCRTTPRRPNASTSVWTFVLSKRRVLQLER